MATRLKTDKKTIEKKSYPIVGIGASAGGLAAFEAFFNGMPEDKDPNMAFVLVQHLAPDYKSILTEIIKRYTRMQVFEVEDGMEVKPNCTYIIPPNRNMALLNGTLQLFEITSPRGQNMPIDYFFRSLAEDQRERAICIILSGTGSDGTLGLRAVKGEGGMAIAQSLDTAEFDGMPSSAITTGLVDYQIPPKEMVKQIISYGTHAYGGANKLTAPTLPNDDNGLRKIFLLIRGQTGHDFSEYKPSTINRRIERRLAVNQIETLTDYIKLLQQSPAEIDSLLSDLLIGVTSFFRDKDAFEKLEKEILPKIFDGKPAGSVIRVWCAGCSTGEEAYSIAILLQEYLEKIKKSYTIQIFATDIDQQAIAIARAGVYPGSIGVDVTPERIAKYFIPEPGNSSYRIIKNVRDMLVFSEQSIIKDPPFSRLDLISCRNLFIYLSSEMQKKLIPLFHYALRPNGILFLGSSETVGDFESMFTILDRKLKFYQRKEDFPGSRRTILPQMLPSAIGAMPAHGNQGPKPERVLPKKSLREITEQAILRENSICGVLVNKEGDVLYIHGRTGMFLEPSQGEAGISNVFRMAREGLKGELTAAFHKMTANNDTIRIPDARVKTNGHFTKVNVIVKQIMNRLSSTDEQALYIIMLEVSKTPENSKKTDKEKDIPLEDTDTRIEELKAELRIKEEYLHSANEELEVSNEELKSSNEEMQSVNEELQSTNEELETSKEELQSINEELATVNAELQVRVHDLSQVNNDMNNLLSGTNIATIFLDPQQNILRFTPTANKIINLILSDVGRPIAHIVSNLLHYAQLTTDVKEVLDTLIPKNIEVETIEGKWYDMIIQPYRTVENVIEGTVLTFVDITEAKKAKELLALSETSYRMLFETSQEGILILDGSTGRIRRINPFLLNLLGYKENEVVGKEVWDIGLLKDVGANKENFLELQSQKTIRYKDMPLQTASGEKIEVEFICNAYEVEKHQVIQCNIRDITHHKQSATLK